jgi:hypothetical protein
MASIPGITNEATSALGEPFVFPSHGNVCPPYITTLSLPSLTIGFSVCFFSTPVILNVESTLFLITSPQEYQPHVDTSSSSLAMSSSISSSSPSEISKDNNLMDNKNKKMNIKKNKIKQGSKLPTTISVMSPLWDIITGQRLMMTRVARWML